jgi:DNA-directed RNA polymerase subunit RPC12/RpoP
MSVSSPAPQVKYPKASACPDAAKHTSSPDGYLAYHAWAEKKMKTHRQERCPTCGFWSIWKPKVKRGL